MNEVHYTERGSGDITDRHFETRRRAFLEFAAASPSGIPAFVGFFNQSARLDLGLPLDEAPIREALTHIGTRRDGGDFAIPEPQLQ